MLKEMADVIAGPQHQWKTRTAVGCSWWLGKTYTCIQRRKKSNDSKLVSPSQTRKTSRSRPWNPLPKTWVTGRQLGAINVNQLRTNHPWPTWFVFQDVITGYTDKKRADNITYLNFHKIFNSVSQSSLILKLEPWAGIADNEMGWKLSGLTWFKLPSH